MGEKEPRSRSTEIIIAVITLVGALGGSVITNWDKIFSANNSPAPLHATQDLTSSTSPVNQQTDSRKAEASENNTRLPSRRDWARIYFKPCVAGTWNVIVKSLDNNQFEALSALNDLAGRFPNVAFKIVQTIARDHMSNERFAIFVGHGLSRVEAKNLVANVRSQGVAADAYAVSQNWASPCSVPDEWQVIR